ncbi:ComF family protein [Aquirhabdus parva]|uniref:ComF family protein n=1 Tax=Aquirhabdus parva TaxID=2283318 RepID=A0A345P8I0_9GAMM|nr:ComF family protein [Aquirhabdus parva]AXI03589.1 ComF family protein [Aquirhabdus parva]
MTHSALGSFQLCQPCLLCQVSSAASKQPICDGCHRDLPWRRDTRWVQDLAVQIAFDYAWPMDRLIHLYKYQDRLDLMAVLQFGLTQLQRPDVDALLAVPLSDTRLRERGFNQSHELAKRLAQTWKIPVWAGITRLDGLRQKGLSRSERLQNVANVFGLEGRGGQPLPARVALIDDVLTTGSTLLSLTQFLKQHGVQQVEAMVIASRQTK